ncbi:MAG TPA: NACHT domain-containing protein [Enterococcus faecalis]|nr:NACHT domain-containing protein [Enterococcus faecalis]
MRKLPKRFFSIVGAALLGTATVWLFIHPNWSAFIALIGGLISFIEAWKETSNVEREKVSPRFLVQVLSALSIGGSIIWFIVTPDFEPLVTVLAGILGLGSSFTITDAPITPDMLREALSGISKTRPKMIKSVKDRWIKDALKNAIFQDRYLHVPLKYNSVLSVEPITLDIVQAFDQSEGKLLILGAPGAGKTVQMYFLIQELLSRAELDENHPIPILYHLSSWVQTRQEFEKWLCEEVPPFYGISRSLFQVWLSGSIFQLLLDGLDEIPVNFRNDCVQAINDFATKYPQVDIVISSRKTDYEKTKNKLKIQNTLVLEPLTSNIIQDYLAKTEINSLLGKDVSFINFASSPLNLDLIARTFENVNISELLQFDTIEKRQIFLFDKYIEHTFKHHSQRNQQEFFKKTKTLQQLGWLAKRMKENNQTLFLIESIQPKWIKNFIGKATHKLSVMIATFFSGVLSGAIVSILFTIPVLFSAMISNHLKEGPTYIANLIIGTFFGGMLLNVIIGTAIGFIGSLVYSFNSSSRFSEKININSQGIIFSGVKGGAIFTIITPVFSFIFFNLKEFLDAHFSTLNFLYGIILFIAVIAITSLPSIVLMGIATKNGSGNLRPKSSIYYKGFGLATFAGLFSIVMESYVPRSNYYSILPSLLLGFILGIILDGISSKEIDSKTRPNQGFHLSIKNGSMLFFIVFLLIDLTSSIVLIPILRASQSFQNIAFSEQIGNIQVITSALSLPISWFISMNNGGSAVIHHIIIRTILWLSGNTPLLYSKFLEYTCELTLLRQIGGAYEFSHPLLRDYLAEKY